MPSLSTVYFVSIMVASVAGIASAFVGNMIHPIKGGTEVPVTEPLPVTPNPLPAVKPTSPLPVTPNPLPAVTAVRTEAEKDAAQLKQAIETVESAPSASSLQDQFLTS